MSTAFDAFFRRAGIQSKHSIHNTPQQLGVAEHMNCSIDEGIMMLLSQSSLACHWWEDAAMHWLYGKTHIPSSKPGSLTTLELFTKQRLDVSHLRPFSCLAGVHLQKDQCPALTPHASQCMLVGYPCDYKGWLVYNPYMQKSFVSDSAIFWESVFPFRKTGLSGVGPPLSSPTPTNSEWCGTISMDFAPLPAAHGSPVAVATSSLATPLLPCLFCLLLLLLLLLPWW